MSQLANAWNRFWFESRSTQSLCLLRIFFGAVFVAKMTGMTNLQRLGNLKIVFPRYTFTSEDQYYLVQDAFAHRVPGFAWLPLPSLWMYQRIEALLVVAAVLFAIGLFTRLAAVWIAGSYTYLFLLSQFAYRHHILLLVAVFLIMALSRCADYYSLDAYLRGPEAPRPKRPILPIRLIQVMISIVYVFSFAMKCNDGWFTGKLMYVYYLQGSVRGDLVDLVNACLAHTGFAQQPDLFWRGATFGLAWFTLFVEGLLIFGLWLRQTRALSIWLGVALQLGIDTTMGVNSFSMPMWVLYIAFLQPQAGRTVVLYDGTCPVCRRSRRWGNLLDWFRRVSWLNFRGAEIRRQVPYLSDEELDATMIVVAADGSLARGYDAWRRLARLFPATFMFAPLLYVLPVPQIGRAAYRWIARHRAGWLRCVDDSCRIASAADAPPQNRDGWCPTLAKAAERHRTNPAAQNVF